MEKCKNVDCDNETIGKRIYCSLSCRSYYVSKYMKNYSKNGDAISKKYRDEYKLNPKLCKNKKCEKELIYEKRENSYCSEDCISIVTRIGRKHSDETKKK